jgi:predicted ABC-class ATPase
MVMILPRARKRTRRVGAAAAKRRGDRIRPHAGGAVRAANEDARRPTDLESRTTQLFTSHSVSCLLPPSPRLSPLPLALAVSSGLIRSLASVNCFQPLPASSMRKKREIADSWLMLPRLEKSSRDFESRLKLTPEHILYSKVCISVVLASFAAVSRKITET